MIGWWGRSDGSSRRAALAGSGWRTVHAHRRAGRPRTRDTPGGERWRASRVALLATLGQHLDAVGVELVPADDGQAPDVAELVHPCPAARTGRAVRGDVLPLPPPDARPQPGRLSECGAGVEVVLPVAVIVVGDNAPGLGVPVARHAVVGDPAAGGDHPVPLPTRLDVVALLDVLERDLARLLRHWSAPYKSRVSHTTSRTVSRGTEPG